MKEFEEWLYKNAYNHGIPRDALENSFAEKAWKAALEWARKNAGGDSSDSRDVLADIDAELEELEQ